MRTTLLLALLAAPGLAGDEEEVRPDWVARDVAVLKQVRAVVDESDAATLFAGLGKADVQEDRAVGFGATRKAVAVHGGYATAWVRAVVYETQVAAIEVRVDAGRAWAATEKRLLQAWGGAPERIEHGFRHVRLDDALLARHRTATEAVLGKNEPKFDLPKELREPYQLLVSPLASYDFGETCYFSGEKPAGRRAVDALVAAKRADLVRRALRGPNPEGRVYAAQMLLRAEETPSAEDRAAIEAIRRLDVPIQCCEGCEVYAAPARKVLPAPK